MSSLRSDRAWIAAVVAPLALVAGLFAAWAVNKASLGDDDGPSNPAASLWAWLRDSDNQFFGHDPFSSDGRVLLGTVVAAVVALLVGFAGTWWALHGLRAGSGLVPAYLSTWMVLVVACVVAALVRWAVVAGTVSVSGAGNGQVQYAVLADGARYGMRFGWLAALLGTLIWAAVRPLAWSDPDPLPAGELADDESREFVMKRRADFNLEDRTSADRNAETFGRRSGDRSELDLDPGPEPEPGPRPEPDRYDPLSAPLDEHGEPAPTYVGRRSSGRYANDEDPAPSAPGGGSHRG